MAHGPNTIPRPPGQSALCSTFGAAFDMPGREWKPGERVYWLGAKMERSPLIGYVRWRDPKNNDGSNEPILFALVKMNIGDEPNPSQQKRVVDPITSHCDRNGIAHEVPFTSDGEL